MRQVNRQSAFLLGLLLALSGCNTPSEPATPPLADGVYEVIASAAEASGLPRVTADTRALIFDRQFVRDGAAEPPEHLLIRVTGHAPLELAEPPTTSEANGRRSLLLTLREEAGQALQELTTHATRAAVIVDGQVVTAHGIRTPIVGGKVQVSC